MPHRSPVGPGGRRAPLWTDDRMRFALDEDDRGLQVKFGLVPSTLGELIDLTPSELGMLMLEKLATSYGAVSPSSTRAGVGASLRTRVPRPDGQPPRRVPGVGVALDRLVADGFGWLIANGLIGPASHAGSAGEWVVTSAGRLAASRGSSGHVDAVRHLHAGLHPLLQGAARASFERGEYAVAVFSALRTVEIALRDVSGLPSTVTGRGLASKALRAAGPFRITAPTADEQDGFMHLFMGAFAALRDPNGHRAVDHDDPTDAADILHLADLLLRIVDREQAARGNRSSSRSPRSTATAPPSGPWRGWP